MILSRFWDNFVSMEKEGRILILRSASASSPHLKKLANNDFNISCFFQYFFSSMHKLLEIKSSLSVRMCQSRLLLEI